jgi:hypothetical protein
MNAQDLVIDRILSALKAVPSIADGNVFEEELTKKPESMNEFVVVRFGSSTPARGTIQGAPIDWTSTIVIESHARSDERTTAGRASRRLAGEVYARLKVDPTLGGAVLDLQEPSLTSDQMQFDTELGCLIAQYPIVHRTKSGSLEAA